MGWTFERGLEPRLQKVLDDSRCCTTEHGARVSYSTLRTHPQTTHRGSVLPSCWHHARSKRLHADSASLFGQGCQLRLGPGLPRLELSLFRLVLGLGPGPPRLVLGLELGPPRIVLGLGPGPPRLELGLCRLSPALGLALCRDLGQDLGKGRLDPQKVLGLQANCLGPLQVRLGLLRLNAGLLCLDNSLQVSRKEEINDGFGGE